MKHDPVLRELFIAALWFAFGYYAIAGLAERF